MSRRRRITVRFLMLLGLTLLVLLGIIGWRGSCHLISPQRRALQDYHREILGKPDEFGLHVEAFTGAGETPCLLVTPSPHPGIAKKSHILRDELIRRGVSLPSWGSQVGTVVLLYGHAGRKEDHLPICERFCAAGFRCLLLDIPGQGDHPQPISTFGLHEGTLVEHVLVGAAKQFGFEGSPACLFGVSQGGAIALQTAALAPTKWRAVASIATFASLDLPVLRSAEEMTPESLHFCCPLAALSVGCATRLRGGFWPSDIRPVDAAEKLNLPVFIGHGDLDPYINIDQARQIFAAVPDRRKKFRVVVGADHNHVLSMGSHALYADVCEFFLAAVNRSTPDFQRAE